MEYKVVISKDEDGFFTAECVELKGCISCGKTKKEALKNIKEAIELYLESIESRGEKICKSKSELVKVTV